MVALGELTHFGAATFDLKLKLVEYLHTELGFNRVVLEAGCSLAGRPPTR